VTFSFDSPFIVSAAEAPMVVMLLKLTAVLVIALAVSALMRRVSATARHMVWLVALVAALALPLISIWSPLPVRVLPPAEAPLVSEVVRAEPAAPTPHAEAPVPTAARTTASAPAPRSIGVGTLMLALWALGVVILLSRLALGAWVVGRIVRRARSLDQPDWSRPLYEVADRLSLDDAPRLVQSDQVKMPYATGVWKAVIVLPAESESWSHERRYAVLIHELAHIKRRDLLGHLVGGIACALYWFHPMVWTAARNLRAESERAADDLALVLGTPASDYAEHLLEIVTQVREDRMPAVALAMAKPREFEGRILAILDPRRRRRGPNRLQTAGLVGALTVLALGVGAMSPARRMIAAAATPSSGASKASLDLADASTAPKTTHQETHTFIAKNTTTSTATSTSKTPSKSKSSEASKAKAEEDWAKDVEKDQDKDEDVAAKEASHGQRAQVLAKSLRTDSDVEVRRVAAWGLSRYANNEVASKALSEALAKDASKDVREMSAWALADSRQTGSVPALDAALRDKSPDVRKTAAWAAGSIGSRSSVPGLIALLADTDPEVREVAAWSIGNCAARPAPPALVKALGDADRDVRLTVAWALYEISDPSTGDEIEAAFRREKDREVQHGLIRALGSMGEQSVQLLTKLVDSPDPEIRAVAVGALAGGNASGPWPWPRPEPRPYP